MDNIWARRFGHYVKELQKYMQYIFTGHIAVVFVFVLGALGYQYSEWLKVVKPEFPAEWLVAIIIGAVLALSRPVTLLRAPDAVYFLPLETKMKTYFKNALNWTFISQVLLPIIFYIVSIPMLRAVTDLTIQEIWLAVLFIAVMKWLNVHIEFHYRYANRGQAISIDRVARLAINVLIIEGYLSGTLLDGLIFLFVLAAYYVLISKKSFIQPVPYEHFVALEESRMLSFYRFANLFTDVPHLRGKVKRRGWLNQLYAIVPYKKQNAQKYLIMRTFIRTDDLFYLFVRLVAIAALFAIFLSIQLITWIVSAALIFALVIQVKQALLANGEFRMDQLFPIQQKARNEAVHWLLICLICVFAFVVTIANIMMPYFYVTPIVIVAAGFATLKLTK